MIKTKIIPVKSLSGTKYQIEINSEDVHCMYRQDGVIKEYNDEILAQYDALQIRTGKITSYNKITDITFSNLDEANKQVYQELKNNGYFDKK